MTSKPPPDTARPGLRTKVFVRDDMIGGGKIDLLAMVDREGSISGAARAMDLTYRRAHFLLETLQRCFEEPLFETTRGGASAGGAKVTELGRELITRYQSTSQAIDAVSVDLLTWLERHQRQEE